jgi:hypothetical protein
MTKRTDGGSVLRCERADGTVTWQKHHGPRAGFFPLHDLTHFAVESVLGTRESFYGLIAQGWDIEDTGGKGARGPLPPEAGMVERIVGLLDLERGSGHLMSGAELRSETASSLAAPLSLDDDTIARIRAWRGELLARWRALPEGKALELDFEIAAGP